MTYQSSLNTTIMHFRYYLSYLFALHPDEDSEQRKRPVGRRTSSRSRLAIESRRRSSWILNSPLASDPGILEIFSNPNDAAFWSRDDRFSRITGS